MLESAVKQLFDYQRFEQNGSLQSVIDEVLDKYAQISPQALADDDLAMAAGGIQLPGKDLSEPEHDGHGEI